MKQHDMDALIDKLKAVTDADGRVIIQNREGKIEITVTERTLKYFYPRMVESRQVGQTVRRHLPAVIIGVCDRWLNKKVRNS